MGRTGDPCSKTVTVDERGCGWLGGRFPGRETDLHSSMDVVGAVNGALGLTTELWRNILHMPPNVPTISAVPGQEARS